VTLCEKPVFYFNWKKIKKDPKFEPFFQKSPECCYGVEKKRLSKTLIASPKGDPVVVRHDPSAVLAEPFNHTAQRGPDEASERPRRGGSAREAPGPREARQGRGSAPLGSYRLTNTDSKWQGLKKTLIEVRKDPKLHSYWKLAWDFVDYLSNMEKARFIASGFDLNKNTSKKNCGLYVHRWTEIYRRRQLAKLYQLGWKENRTSVTMMTLTTYQDGEYSLSIKGKPVTIEESFELLKDGWNKLSKILRKYIKDLNYIWVVEPHASGYPHLHVVIFTQLSDNLQNKIKKLWSEKYQTGSKDHGVDFTTRTPEEDIDSLRNYLMKYIAKGFVSTGSKFSETSWTKEELVFNALIWKNGFRTFHLG